MPRDPHNETCRKIVNAVAGLAADLDLSCVVEGVEAAEQRSALPGGVQLHGYLTGRPQPPEVMDSTCGCPDTSDAAPGTMSTTTSSDRACARHLRYEPAARSPSRVLAASSS